MILTESLAYDFIGILISILALLVIYSKWLHGYWKRRGLQGPDPVFLLGNTKDMFLLRKSSAETFGEIYFELKSKGLRHGGVYFFWKPHYVPTDLEIIKAIMVTDATHFASHGSYINEHHDPLSGHIFALEGERWKTMRRKLSPTFTSSKTKMMFQLIVKCGNGLKTLLEESYNQKLPVDVRETAARFTTDTIGSCVFGIEANSMQKPDAELRTCGANILDEGVSNTIRLMAGLVIPHWFLDLIKFHAFEPNSESFFYSLVRDNVNYREKNNVVRKDFLNMLIQLKNKGKLSEDGKEDLGSTINAGTLTFDELAAQCFVFYLAGFETSSTTFHFAVYELAINPDIQEKARELIKEVLQRHDNKITYEAVQEMTYLDNIISESLRKYPAVANLIRLCTKDYKVPNSDVILEKGTLVQIPLHGLHYDTEYYPNPTKFDPDRFIEENKKTRPSYTWMPFGEGQRICIGMRFGILQTKFALLVLLRNYKFLLSKKTKTPITFTKTPTTYVEGGVWINLERVS